MGADKKIDFQKLFVKSNRYVCDMFQLISNSDLGMNCNEETSTRLFLRIQREHLYFKHGILSILNNILENCDLNII